MSKKRRQHSVELKSRVALEALKGIEAVHTIAARYQVHPVQVSQWKKEAAERLPEVFARKGSRDHDAEVTREREKELFEEIGRLKMELEWLKKKLASSSVEERRRMIEPRHPGLPISRQCELLGLARASYYRQPEPETDENLRLMRVIDETYLAYPVFGSRQMTRWLRRQGHAVNRKRVRRLMQQMGLEAIYQQPNVDREMFSIEGRDIAATFRGDGNVTLSITGTGTVRVSQRDHWKPSISPGLCQVSSANVRVISVRDVRQ